MNKVWIIIRKEILNSLRDTRTLITVFALPLILFPVIFTSMGYFTMKEKTKEETKVYNIGIINPVQDTSLLSYLKKGGNLNIFEGKDVKQMFNKKAKAVIEIKKAEESEKVIIYYDGADKESNNAIERVEKKLKKYKNEIVRRKIVNYGLSEEILEPFGIEKENIASLKKMSGFILGTIIPYILILLSFSGAMSTGLDITIGEKERKTLETLLVTDVKRGEIVIGKIASISLISLFATISALFGLIISVYSGFSILTSGFSSIISMPWSSCIWILILMLPLLWLFSSIIAFVGGIAKNRKEADGYALYFYFIIIFLAFISMASITTPSSKIFFIPVLNTAIIQQQVLVGKINLMELIITLGSTIVYAIITFLFTEKVFGRESTLFRE